MGGYKHNSSFWDNRAGRDAPPCFASRPLKRGMSDPNPYPRLHPPPPSLTRASCPPLHPLRPVYLHRSGLFYARFQPILGTLLSPPGDFRDHLPIFPKIFWIRGLFFKNMSRILGGAKGRFCPVAGGGWVSLCLPACRRSRCPVLRSGPVPGGPVDHYRKTGGRSGSLQADTTGPARCRSLRPLIWPGLVGYMGIFSPAGFLAL